MRTHPLRSTLVLILACLLAILFYFLGMVVPQANFRGGFLLPILVAFLWGRRRDIYIVTALASILAPITFWAGGSAGLDSFLINELLPLGILWAAAWLLAQRRLILDRQQELAAEVAARKAELEASEQRYRLLAENAGNLIWTVDMDGAISYVSPAVERLRGVTREEEHSADWTDRMPPQFAAVVSARVAADLAALRAGTPIERVPRVTQAYRKDGSLFWIETVLSPLYDDAGRPLGLCGTTRDITARHQAEEALRRSEDRFNKLFSSSPVGITLTRLADGQFQEANGAFLAMVGCDREEIIGRSSRELDLISPEDWACRMSVLQVQKGLQGHELELCSKRGEQLQTLLAVEVVDFEGEPCLLSSVVDITKRKQLEEQLRAANQRLQLATDAAGIGIWTWDFADYSLAGDDRMFELYGITAEERGAGISYDNWRTRIHPDDLALADPAQGDPGQISNQWSGTYRVMLPGGAIRYIQADTVLEYSKAGVPLRMVGINRDITDQEQYEQVLQGTNAILEQRVALRTADLEAALGELQLANQLKDEFMAMISHELRTPLSGVLSMAEMLDEQVAGPLNGRQATYVRGITASGERLLHVINGILGYTHLLSGKVRLQAKPCSLASVLNTCAADLQHTAAAKRLTIAVHVEPPDLAITGDAAAIADVLKRLLDNALKFTPEGGQIGLEACPGARPGTIGIIVWDTGSGIVADQLEHILKPFAQADRRLARSHEGVGLGLAYVDQMVRLMGGTVVVASAVGEGSRFTITLPAQ